MRKRSTLKDKDIRYSIIINWIVKNPSISRAVLLKNIIKQWDISERQARRYLKECEAYLINEANNKDLKFERERLLKFIDWRLNELKNSNNENVIIGYLKLKIELLGLNKYIFDINLNNNLDNDFKKLSDKELIKLYETKKQE